MRSALILLAVGAILLAVFWHERRARRHRSTLRQKLIQNHQQFFAELLASRIHPVLARDAHGWTRPMWEVTGKTDKEKVDAITHSPVFSPERVA